MKKLILVLFFLLTNISFGQSEFFWLAFPENKQIPIEATSYDSDAQAFIDAVSTLTTPEEIIINDLVLGFKANGTWSKYHAIYPYIGGTAAEHKWNLKDPRDLDVAFRLTWSGTWTHNADGITGDGSTAYANTYLFPTVTLSATSVTHGTYSKSDVSEVAIELGVGKSGDYWCMLGLKWGSTFWSWIWGSSNPVSLTAPATNAMYQATQTGGTTHKAFRNGVQIGSTNTGDNTANFSNLITYSFYIGAVNNGGEDKWYSTKIIAFSFIADALTDSEILDDYNTIETYQTALSRENYIPFLLILGFRRRKKLKYKLAA